MSPLLLRFIVEPRSQIVAPGASAILTCAVEPEEEAVIRWTFNGQTLSGTTRRRAAGEGDDEHHGGSREFAAVRRRGVSTRHTRNEHSLHVAAFDASRHEGVYQCRATSGPAGGSILSRPAKLEPAGEFHASLQRHNTLVMHAFTAIN